MFFIPCLDYDKAVSIIRGNTIQRRSYGGSALAEQGLTIAAMVFELYLICFRSDKNKGTLPPLKTTKNVNDILTKCILRGMKSILEHLRTVRFNRPSIVLTGLMIAVSAAASQNIVIVVIDGPRSSDLFGAGAVVSRPMQALFSKGTLFTNFFNDYVTLTMPGHGAIVTGAWQLLANDGSKRPYRPTLSEYHRKVTGSRSTDHYIVAGKSILGALTFSSHKDFGETYAASLVLASDDRSVFDSTVAVMMRYQPTLLFVAFPSVDGAGHGGNFTEYQDALRNVFSLISDLWNAVQSSLYYRNRTILLVTADHGRHDDAHGGFQHHGDRCEGCKRLFLLVIGPGIPAAEVRLDSTYQIDITPTIGGFLGLATTLSDGRNLFPGYEFPDSWEEPVIAPLFELTQNHPNPFNPSTVINLAISEGSSLTLTITDILGRVVSIQEKPQALPGFYSFYWDGLSLAGERMPSGVYFYTLSATSMLRGEATSQTRKMVLIR